MQELTSAAGLTDEWDRMVVVFPGTSEATLNSDAGTTGVCWANLPGTYGDDTPHTAYYLFVAGDSPSKQFTGSIRATVRSISCGRAGASFIRPHS